MSQGPFDLSLPRLLTDYKRMRIPRPRKIDDGNSIVFFIKEVFLESENVVVILDFIIQTL
jgi:hypothetical protein